jgi:3-oxoacyl-[acyl-carrier protein] reductase
MAIELTDKVCLITGADEGVGYGLAQGFLSRGACVAVGLLHPERYQPPSPEVLAMPMDVTAPEQIEAAIAAVIARWGRLDVLVNNAGVYPRISADEITPEQWLQIQDINLNGAWRSCHAAIPHFKAQGSGVILNIGSITLRSGMPRLSHYQASKGGIVGLTRGLARDLGRHGIRVNCVHLGAVLTEGEKRLVADPKVTPVDIEGLQCLPGRMTPETVEPTFAFLASDDSGDITGQCLTVDRGWVHD